MLYEQVDCKSKAGCEVNWQNVSAGPPGLHSTQCCRSRASPGPDLDRAAHRAGDYILAQTSCSSYSSVPKLKVLEGYSAKYSWQSFSAMTMGRCIAHIASYLCRYFCFESISSERICICTELICICTETADQEGISRVGAATDLFGADSKAALRTFSDYVLFQFVFFLGRILSLNTAIALNAPQITAIGFCQEVNN